MKHLLKLMDCTKDDITKILNVGDQMKFNQKNGINHSVLKGKSLAMIFSKSSTRTRVSFEVGMYQLGGMAMFLSSNDLQIGRGEPIEDTARVLSRYVDGIMIRTFAQSDVEGLAKHGTIPVINGLTDFAHPCQALADLMTIREKLTSLEGHTLTFIGDGNNVCNSLIVGGLLCGMKVKIAVPKGYEPDSSILKFAEGKDFFMTDNPFEAAKDSDVVYTDVWASMGQESEAQKRIEAFKGFEVNEDLMKKANQNAMVLHCLPAHRGEEISAETFEKHAEEIFSQAENRLHVQKSVMAELMK